MIFLFTSDEGEKRSVLYQSLLVSETRLQDELKRAICDEPAEYVTAVEEQLDMVRELIDELVCPQ